LERDFRSFAAQGRLPRHEEPDVRRLWDGVSVYDSAEHLRRLVRNRPHLGTFVAELTVPDDGSIRYEKTRGAGHYTIWASAAELRGSVVDVTPVELNEGRVP
jgi:hypothetical protein